METDKRKNRTTTTILSSKAQFHEFQISRATLKKRLKKAKTIPLHEPIKE